MGYRVAAPPARFLRSARRRAMWANAARLLRKLATVFQIREAYLLGSFASEKLRPADVDMILLVKTGAADKWSLDLVLAPDGAHGQVVLEDAAKWVKQKYGSKKSAVVRII